MRQAALLVVLVCVLAVPLAGAAGAEGPASQQGAQAAELPEEGVDVTVQIQADGAARWTISTKYPLYTENDTAAFEALRDDFEAYETDTEFSVDVFRAVVPDVSEQTGREMEIRNPDRTSEVIDHGNNSTGVLSVQFTWSNFSRVDNETLVVDSFTGTWFGDLQAGQSLTIQPPDDYDTDRVQPGPSAISDGAYVWEGPQQFTSGQPVAVFTASGGPITGPVGVSMEMVVGIGLLALLLGAILVWAYYGEFPSEAPAGIPLVSDWLGGSGEDANRGESVEGDGGSEAASAAGESDAAQAGEGAGTDAGAGGDAGTGTGAGAAAGAGAGAASGATAGGDVDPELLSDEERVERLLREHGGRMKQSKIVEETRWSTAKVSQLLSSMADEGRVEKLRIGRENLISLPDEGLDDE